MLSLMHRVKSSLSTAYRPRTVSMYDRQFRLFLAFAVFLNIQDIQDIHFILAFLQLLYDNGLGQPSVANYVSSFKQQFQIYSLNHKVLEHRKVALLLKSFAINRPLQFKPKGIISVQLLADILQACKSLLHPALFKAVFSFAFFSFLRISNIAPPTESMFDLSRHLARGDIIWGHPGAHIILKWSKTMQTRREHQVVQIPVLCNSSLCPVTALQNYFHQYPTGPNMPLFSLPSGRALTQAHIRQALTSIIHRLHLSAHNITFHSFRRSGATAVFNQNVQLQNIQVHGGWQSTAIWHYLKSTHQAAGEVARTFQRILQ